MQLASSVKIPRLRHRGLEYLEVGRAERAFWAAREAARDAKAAEDAKAAKAAADAKAAKQEMDRAARIAKRATLPYCRKGHCGKGLPPLEV